MTLKELEFSAQLFITLKAISHHFVDNGSVVCMKSAVFYITLTS